ncbi:hypothetical protein [Phytobacter diazotrophicus]|uniref:hypothetical protein n=1 Tax=Phytobacter diazotrophicus TaxID=395631 RepID=UPI0029367775|nr:hypothetical protein [Phytobacter diazotrophicus]MDV2871363.1 hypothetical protein [Phytobacter diazotrophicus]
MNMSESEFKQFNSVAENILQAELVCALLEDHPHQLTDIELGALASLVKKLAGDAYVYMSTVIHQQENQK